MSSQSKSQPTPRRHAGDDVRLHAWRAILEVRARLLQVFADEMKDGTDIDLDTYDALLHVYEAGPEGIRMTDLSRRLVLSKSGVTTVVDRLEEKGLFRRVPDPDDRRAVRVAITDDGYALFRSAAKVHMIGLERHWSRYLTDDDARTLLEILGRVEPDA